VFLLTTQDVLAHQNTVPWPELYQIEQDLLLSLAMRGIFEDPFLSQHVAMRGGTVLHKVHLPPAARYSEDIDLVAVTSRDEQHIQKALKRVLRSVLGRERSSTWDTVRLFGRNLARPSRILRCVFKVQSASTQDKMLVIEVEVNVSERNPKYEPQLLPFAVPFRGQTLNTSIRSFNINEMLGTKMRALFQRKKGRDLFDLYHALTSPSVVPVS
jgi:predicted nucleotidyltransferase component of viral defense system